MIDKSSADVPSAPQDELVDVSTFSDANWASTYGVLTVERTLGRLNVFLEPHELIDAIKNPNNAYFQLLRVPMQNVFNGIILQQAIDYQVYVQKLYVDYLLSGEGNKEEDSPGADARERLEEKRLLLVAMGESFANLQLEHKGLIAESQAYLMSKAKDINPALPHELKNEIKVVIDGYAQKTHTIKASICDYRSRFYEMILDVTSLINALPDFHIDDAKTEENREPLHFDAMLGNDKNDKKEYGG